MLPTKIPKTSNWSIDTGVEDGAYLSVSLDEFGTLSFCLIEGTKLNEIKLSPEHATKIRDWLTGEHDFQPRRGI